MLARNKICTVVPPTSNLATVQRTKTCRALFVKAVRWLQDFYPVHAAVLRRDAESVEEALSLGVRFSKQDSEGNLPLHCGVAANDLDIVAMLLAAGAPVNLPNRQGRTATQVAMLLVRIDV